jgi:hypothetical protein
MKFIIKNYNVLKFQFLEVCKKANRLQGCVYKKEVGIVTLRS